MTADYLKLFHEHLKLKKEIKNSMDYLTMENKNLKRIIKMYEEKFEIKVNEAVQKDNALLKIKYEKIIKELKQEYQQELKEKDLFILKLEKQDETIISDFKNENEALKKEVAKLTSILDNDSTNSGIPPSKNPLNKSNIQNSRKKTNKKPGGQEGRKKHYLEAFSDEEATEIINITPEKCPNCGSEDIIELGTSNDKCVTDYKVKVIKTKYKFKNCSCGKCNKEFREKIPCDLKEENQYGTNIKALSLCLTNEIYTPFNKTVKLINGLTNGEIKPSEGYVTKLQKKYGKKLESFINDLKIYFPKQEVYGWDDTTISINGKRSALRVYCTDKVSLFCAHLKKDKNGIDEDGILLATSSHTIVMHDHLLVNYNKDYNFQNVECLIHVIRRLKKIKEDTKHKWPDELKDLLSKTNLKRNQLIEEGISEFTKEDLNDILQKYDEILEKGFNENHEDMNNYFQQKEFSLIKDLGKYKDSYLLWIFKFNIPSTNNTSERNVRPTKSKMKISGQFKNIAFARYHASLRSYIETCKRNNIDIMKACERLVNNNPYTLDEILEHAKKG